MLDWMYSRDRQGFEEKHWLWLAVGAVCALACVASFMVVLAWLFAHVT